MYVSQVKYKTNASDPNDRFRHEHIEVTVDLTKDDNIDTAFSYARQIAREQLGLDVEEDDVIEAERVLEKARKAGLR